MTIAPTTTYSVPEISCGHCQSSIEAAVGAVDGVAAVEVDIEAKTVSVSGGERGAVVAAIEDAGFDVAG